MPRRRSDRGHHQQRRRIIPVGLGSPSVPPELAEHAELARAFGEAHGLPEYSNRKVECDDMRAWEFAAVALGGASGHLSWTGVGNRLRVDDLWRRDPVPGLRPPRRDIPWTRPGHRRPRARLGRSAERATMSRGDPPALALRGIALAQLGDLERARALLRRAARSARSRSWRGRVAIGPDVALAMRDLDWPTKRWNPPAGPAAAWRPGQCRPCPAAACAAPAAAGPGRRRRRRHRRLGRRCPPPARCMPCRRRHRPAPPAEPAGGWPSPAAARAHPASTRCRPRPTRFPRPRRPG